MDLHERLLVQVSARDVYDAMALAGHPGSGLVFTGQAAHDAVRMVRRHGYDGPLLADRRRYAGSARVRGTVRLSPDWIADQVESGATLPLTDSGYIGKGDHEALHTTLEQAVQWKGVIAVLPVHPRWVAEDRTVLLRTVIDYGVRTALVIEDGPPYRPGAGHAQPYRPRAGHAQPHRPRVADAQPHRPGPGDAQPYTPVPLPLLGAGVEALAALAHGAEWAAVGVREVLRHLYPEPHEVSGGWRRGGARSAFVPDRLEFVPVERLREETCGCSPCHGRPLRRLAGAEELEVNTHNAAALHRLHHRLLRATHRERWWRDLARSALATGS
ncbi:hypothetical protein [Nonomuraea zeae]|uniref:tRNA-guanine(15) transglycosylase-like domain-containing protein n=1 Tax=Nonomuraea zeae TaxID=1642303 RepID=A0A5S4FKX1_9ACTN|nr:hypothetical protein [Nonomuraea zeae]TMR21249.1 hypothetical protein ETD85_51160 [Nonomuraea zeae]